MRIALISLAALAGALALGLAVFWPSPERAAEGETSLPVFLGSADDGDEIERDAFGPGPTVCSMDPRYRPKPGLAETCPVIP